MSWEIPKTSVVGRVAAQVNVLSHLTNGNIAMLMSVVIVREAAVVVTRPRGVVIARLNIRIDIHNVWLMIRAGRRLLIFILASVLIQAVVREGIIRSAAITKKMGSIL